MIRQIEIVVLLHLLAGISSAPGLRQKIKKEGCVL